jgi:hypothetical protein
MRVIVFLLFFIFQFLNPYISEGFAEELNPWNLPINKRVIHRKNVSHLLIDPRSDHCRVVLVLGDRFPYSYKSTQYGLYIKTTSEKEALEIMNAFDKQLGLGYEIYLKLNGSRIVEWSFSS